MRRTRKQRRRSRRQPGRRSSRRPRPRRPRSYPSGRGNHDRLRPTTRRCGSSSLHDLGYCHRLFYLTEVEGLQAPNAAIYAGRELHAALEADEDGERTQLELADPGLGLVGKVDALRRRDGSLVPYEHKRGRCRRGDDKVPGGLAVRPAPGRRLRCADRVGHRAGDRRGPGSLSCRQRHRPRSHRRARLAPTWPTPSPRPVACASRPSGRRWPRTSGSACGARWPRSACPRRLARPTTPVASRSGSSRPIATARPARRHSRRPGRA